MAYSNEIVNAARDRLSERRQNALRAADYAREELFTSIPRLSEINDELMSIGASTAKCMLRSNDPDDVRKLRDRSLALQKEREEILSARGLSLSVLKPKFTCEKCEDTGYIELEDRTEVCECMFRLMAEIACEQLNATLPLDKCTFETFKLDYYSNVQDEAGRIPLDRMSKIYNHCRKYADEFSLKSKNLLMRGATGLGKTHLSLAIANEVIKKGMSVIYMPAQDMLSRLEREHFAHGSEKGESTFQSLLECDLLIIDDLGTEFSTQFTVSCIYNLLNSRLLAEKPLIISTNMSMSELVESYSQRFVSRLIGSCDRLDFIGEDVRTIRKARA